MLAGAAPLLFLGLARALLLAVTGKTGHVLDNATLRRTVASAARTLGPGVVSLVAVLSTVGHKEWRFIVYAIPALNIVAGACAAALSALPRRSLRLLARLGLVGLLSLTAAFALFSTYVSTHNYPGGDVWRALEAARLPAGSVIHLHSYPLQTGASLFTFLRTDAVSPAFPAPVDIQWTYSKSEDPALQTPQGAWLGDVEAVVTERWREFADAEIDGHRMWALIGACDGFDGVQIGKEGLQVRSSRKIGLLRRL
jgi:alpha-1,6-mannosyltransferase